MAKATQQAVIGRVTPDEVMRRMDRGESVVFVDSRNPQAWGESNEKLPGAIRIPAGDVGRHLNEIPKRSQNDEWAVTYCA